MANPQLTQVRDERIQIKGIHIIVSTNLIIVNLFTMLLLY